MKRHFLGEFRQEVGLAACVVVRPERHDDADAAAADEPDVVGAEVERLVRPEERLRMLGAQAQDTADQWNFLVSRVGEVSVRAR